jgi:hypothetical protein
MPAPTSYKEYCKQAYERDPKFWGKQFNADGSVKTYKWWTKSKNTNRILERFDKLDDIPKEELRKLPKDFIPKQLNRTKTRKPIVSITGTQLKYCGKEIDMTIWDVPSNCSRKEYKRIWMHNCRVRLRIKVLKEKHGVTYKL